MSQYSGKRLGRSAIGRENFHPWCSIQVVLYYGSQYEKIIVKTKKTKKKRFIQPSVSSQTSVKPFLPEMS